MKKWEKIDSEYNGHRCEKYIINNIVIASYNHTLIRDDPDGEYKGYIDLPVLRNKKISGTREQVKSEIERLVTIWINQLNKGNNND